MAICEPEMAKTLSLSRSKEGTGVLVFTVTVNVVEPA